MSHLEFEWSPVKAASNVKKHGVSFEEARSVFEDEEALLIPDPEHSVDEERFVLLGVSASSRLVVVIHCERGPDVIRIISARKADRTERAAYISRRTR